VKHSFYQAQPHLSNELLLKNKRPLVENGVLHDFLTLPSISARLMCAKESFFLGMRFFRSFFPKCSAKILYS
jgi:hypothetical protein